LGPFERKKSGRKRDRPVEVVTKVLAMHSLHSAPAESVRLPPPELPVADVSPDPRANVSHLVGYKRCPQCASIYDLTAVEM
jgi:hypothetical protein